LTWVLDASAALGLALGDGDESLASVVSVSLERAGAIVPQHWPLEVNNGLLMAFRRGRIPLAAAHRAQELLLELPIEIDTETAERCWGASFELATEYGLTVYDAAYLELALRLEAPLATADRALAEAARKAGVPLAGDPGDSFGS
jgi:predicted nucleic acid-binding protein